MPTSSEYLSTKLLSRPHLFSQLQPCQHAAGSYFLRQAAESSNAHLAAFTNSCSVAYNACSRTSSMGCSNEPLLQPVNSTLRRAKHGRDRKPAEACLFSVAGAIFTHKIVRCTVLRQAVVLSHCRSVAGLELSHV
jgi:hypothetical protein